MTTPLKANRPHNRLVGSNPKIGIRPTIDGRLGGVRESLEKQTMTMAKSVARLIGDAIRHADGTKVECIIADRTIGGIAEASMCAEKFAREGVGVSITVTPCWCYGSETMDMDPLTPKAVWGFNGTERPGAVYLAAVSAGHNQKGHPIFTIYGRDVQDGNEQTIPADVQTKLLQFARAGLAVATMRGKSYASIGATSMGIAGSVVDTSFFEAYLGMRVMFVDEIELVRRMDRGIFDQKEFTRALAWVKSNCKEGMDANNPKKIRSREAKDKEWEICVKMAMIARDLMIGNPKLAEMGFGEEALGHNSIAAGFQGQRQWTDHLPNGDFLEAILCSSFDWNGIRQPFVVATENDCLNGATMLFGHLLTGGAQVFADVRTYWSPDAVRRVTGKKLTGDAEGGILHLINSGPAALDATGEQEIEGRPAMKPWWTITPEDAGKCLGATEWCPAIYEYFCGGGFSTRFKTRGGMPITAARLNIIKGIGPALQIAEGVSVELDDDVHDVLDQRTNPTWPTTWFVPRTTGSGAFRDVYTVMNNWGANHCAFAHGHIGHELITLASMLRIPVYMHNMEEERVYRPSVWVECGDDLVACKNFGPLYGKY
ncbi:MAG TPA: L-fucose isomerase [Verrucomicrobiae bacterium]|nr:L-fucose isomerase [Verrucomicrobiae bacterium]